MCAHAAIWRAKLAVGESWDTHKLYVQRAQSNFGSVMRTIQLYAAACVVAACSPAAQDVPALKTAQAPPPDSVTPAAESDAPPPEAEGIDPVKAEIIAKARAGYAEKARKDARCNDRAFEARALGENAAREKIWSAGESRAVLNDPQAQGFSNPAGGCLIFAFGFGTAAQPGFASIEIGWMAQIEAQNPTGPLILNGVEIASREKLLKTLEAMSHPPANAQ